MEEKYITVLDYSDGKIYQYENLEHFKDGWNGNDKVDGESIEWYLTEVKGHRLNDINWMAHNESRIWTDYSETITN
mgnify:FL=1